MAFEPVTIREPADTNRVPLIVDSPHSGRGYPPDFTYICPLPLIRQTEDFVVDELVSGATSAGATLITANFPRSYIDVNRAQNDIDPDVLDGTWDEPLQLSERTALGLGLVRRLCTTGVPVYAARLPVKEVKRRIANYYHPYHAALTNATKQNSSNFGVSYLLNCHSMPSRSHDGLHATRPDFILGDRDGTSCDPAFTRVVHDLLLEMNYSVSLNEPYKGMEIVRRHGNPSMGRHALQIEINRSLYMDEREWKKNDGFVLLRKNLTGLFAAIASSITDAAPEQMAAE